MSSELCRCGGEITHEGNRCCWCWIFDLGQAPHPGHGECLASVKRLEVVQARFREAVLAERDGCVKAVEELISIPKGAFPAELVRLTRLNPRKMLSGMTNVFVENAVKLIRSRLDPVPNVRRG